MKPEWIRDWNEWVIAINKMALLHGENQTRLVFSTVEQTITKLQAELETGFRWENYWYQGPKSLLRRPSPEQTWEKVVPTMDLDQEVANLIRKHWIHGKKIIRPGRFILKPLQVSFPVRQHPPPESSIETAL